MGVGRGHKGGSVTSCSQFAQDGGVSGDPGLLGAKAREFSSVQFSRSVVSNSLRPHESQPARPPCPSPAPGVHSDSRPSSQ